MTTHVMKTAATTTGKWFSLLILGVIAAGVFLACCESEVFIVKATTLMAFFGIIYLMDGIICRNSHRAPQKEYTIVHNDYADDGEKTDTIVMDPVSI